MNVSQISTAAAAYEAASTQKITYEKGNTKTGDYEKITYETSAYEAASYEQSGLKAATYEKSRSLAVHDSDYGNAVGEVTLSDTAAKYYESLKERYGDSLNFVLVSEDVKDAANAISGTYASSDKMTVLIDVDKIEKMATDESYRDQIEGLLTQSVSQMSGLADSLGTIADDVVGYGMQVNDDGTATYFAVLKDMSAKAEELREERAEKKQEERKAEEKEEQAERLEELRSGAYSGRTTTIKADSIDELLQKIEDYTSAASGDTIVSEPEAQVGQVIDFRG